MVVDPPQGQGQGKAGGGGAVLETPDLTKAQYAAIVQLIVVVGAALGLEVTDAAATSLTVALTAAGSAFVSILVGADAAIRRGRAANADKIKGQTAGVGAATSGIPAAWTQAIPATGWWARTGPRPDDRRPIAAWAFVSSSDGGTRLAGLVRKGQGFGLAEDAESFAGYEFDAG